MRKVEPTSLTLTDGTVIPFGLCIWSTGVGPTAFTLGLPFAKTQARARARVCRSSVDCSSGEHCPRQLFWRVWCFAKVWPALSSHRLAPAGSGKAKQPPQTPVRLEHQPTNTPDPRIEPQPANAPHPPNKRRQTCQPPRSGASPSTSTSACWRPPSRTRRAGPCGQRGSRSLALARWEFFGGGVTCCGVISPRANCQRRPSRKSTLNSSKAPQAPTPRAAPRPPRPTEKVTPLTDEHRAVTPAPGSAAAAADALSRLHAVPDVYALGDCCANPQTPLPALAQARSGRGRSPAAGLGRSRGLRLSLMGLLCCPVAAYEVQGNPQTRVPSPPARPPPLPSPAPPPKVAEQQGRYLARVLNEQARDSAFKAPGFEYKHLVGGRGGGRGAHHSAVRGGFHL